MALEDMERLSQAQGPPPGHLRVSPPPRQCSDRGPARNENGRATEWIVIAVAGIPIALAGGCHAIRGIGAPARN